MRILTQIVLATVAMQPVALEQSGANATLPAIDISGSPNGVVLLADDVPAVFTDVFVKYTKVVAPNGKPIHVLAQDGWSDARVVKARKVLEHMLTGYPDSQYGSNKTLVANTMADNKATLVLFNTSDDLREAMNGPLGQVDLGMQDLRANECPIEGSDDYMNRVTRDASYEEVLHMVQDYGIIPALPEFEAEIEAANAALMERALWDPWGGPGPGGHSNEYFAVVYDNYLELWTVQPTKYEGRDIGPGEIPEGTSHFGVFRAANGRAALKVGDPAGFALMEKFFPPYLTYTPELPETFEGTFSIQHDAAKRYTTKSQHLKNVTLTGSSNANLLGNAWDNLLTGNRGDNQLTGWRGNDLLKGGAGNDTAVFAGARADYVINGDRGHATVRDTRINRDGTDILIDVEFLQFSDQRVTL